MEAFRLAIEENGLMDLGWFNQKFMWLNWHYDNTITKERLDRAVANKAWVTAYGCSGVEILTSGLSDHQPIMLTTRGGCKQGLKGKKVFIFEAHWTLEKDGESTIWSLGKNN